MPAARSLKVADLCRDCKEREPMRRRRRKFDRCRECRTEHLRARLRSRATHHRLVGTEGTPVMYYDDGWRAGILLNLGHAAANVQPIGPGERLPIRVTMEDLKVNEFPFDRARLPRLFEVKRHPELHAVEYVRRDGPAPTAEEERLFAEARKPKAATCKNGHPVNLVNASLGGLRRGVYVCQPCKRDAAARFAAKNK